MCCAGIQPVGNLQPIAEEARGQTFGKHGAKSKKIPGPYDPEPEESQREENAGFVLWKDNKIVIMYCVDLGGKFLAISQSY